MSGITDPSEEYFKNGLWAWVTDQWKKLIGDDAGHLQVDVVESGLPSGAATSANQATMITALQLIDDLRAALNSVATDELDVVIDGQTADVEIKQTAAADLTPGIMGWDGSAWHKLPMLFGYSDRWAETVNGTASGAGDASIVTAAVPAGYVYVLQVICSFHDAGVDKILDVYLRGNSTYVWFYQNLTATSGFRYTWNGEIVLGPGDRIYAKATAPGDGKKVYLECWGYKMKIGE